MLLVGLAYAPSLPNGFIWDDDDYILNNQTLRTPAGLARIWREPTSIPQYYPLVHTTFWLEYQLWGTDALGYHAVNILLHGLSACLLWQLLRRLQVPAAWLVAALFAVHPVHVESVAWITERKNVLSAACYFIASLFFVEHFGIASPCGESPRSNSLRAWALYFLGATFFLAALLSKTVTCTLPAALLLVMWWRRYPIRRGVVAKIAPLLVLGIGLGLLTVQLERTHVGAVGDEFAWSFAERLQIAGQAAWRYAGKLVWPFELAFFYPKWPLDAGKLSCWLAPLALLLTLLGLTGATARGWLSRGPLTAVLYFLGTLFPALGFFNILPLRYSFYADHFQYLASVGLLALLGSGGWLMLKALAQRLIPEPPESRVRSVAVPPGAVLLPGLAVAPLVIGLMLLTMARTTVYRDLPTLWRDTIAKNPESAAAHNNLGVYLLVVERDRQQALQLFRESLRLKPAHNREALSNLKMLEGELLATDGKTDDALARFREAAEIDPTNPLVFFGMGITQLAADRPADAVASLEQAKARASQHAPTHFYLAQAYHAVGRRQQARDAVTQALALRPGWAEAESLRKELLPPESDAAEKTPPSPNGDVTR